MNPMISIVIPHKGDEERLRKVVNQLEYQTFRQFETIVVRNKTRSEARNIGVNQANGDFILFLDSDILLNPVFLDECMKLYDSPKTILFGLRSYPNGKPDERLQMWSEKPVNTINNVWHSFGTDQRSQNSDEPIQ